MDVSILISFKNGRSTTFHQTEASARLLLVDRLQQHEESMQLSDLYLVCFVSSFVVSWVPTRHALE